jgi:hypothetical protein
VPRSCQKSSHVVCWLISGRLCFKNIVALVQKASDIAKADCQRAMDLAHRVSSELREAEERARKFEAEANYFRDRAVRAEEWLVRIESELQRTFFQTK